jgi:hypothetical protein
MPDSVPPTPSLPGVGQVLAAATVVVAEAELLPGTGSTIVLETEALFVIVEPAVAPASTRTLRVAAESWPEGREARVQETLPVPPTAGVVQLQPPGVETERKVVLVGTASVSVTTSAVAGPLLVTTIV